MKLSLTKAVGFFAICGITVGAAQIPAQAEGVNSGVLTAISAYMDMSVTAEKVETDTSLTTQGQTEEETTTCGYTNLGIANVESNLNVRKEADESAEIVGKMPANAGCEILEQDGEWYKIQSGKVTGYVKGEYLVTGEEAKALAEEVQTTIATVTTTTLNVRAKKSTDSSILALMPEGEELLVLKEYKKWIKIDLDGDEGYVSKDYVTITQKLAKAQTMTELKYGQGISNARVSLVAYATQFVGNPYVWGGTSLTKGADCSGFVLSVFANYGVYLPHSSRAQANSGTTINASDAQPGDLFFYGNGGGINHVAIYIGNGQVVHASSPRTGIKISNAFYRSPVKVVRILSE